MSHQLHRKLEIEKTFLNDELAVSIAADAAAIRSQSSLNDSQIQIGSCCINTRNAHVCNDD